MRRVLLGVAWYLSIGIAVGIETGLHQAARIDPGFDPRFTAVVTVLVWPAVLLNDLGTFMAYLGGALPRH